MCTQIIIEVAPPGRVTVYIIRFSAPVERSHGPAPRNKIGVKACSRGIITGIISLKLAILSQ